MKVTLFFLPPSGPRTKKPKKQPGDKTAANGSSAMSMSAIGLGGGGGMGSTSCAVTANDAMSPLSAASSQSVNSPDSCGNANDDKRPRTAFSGPQLARLKVRDSVISSSKRCSAAVRRQ